MRLSGGQQQRLSIARAILRNPELLVLDEATSQLDTLTEKIIQEIISSYRGERTILVVAHRLSTIRRANCIAVMQDGQVMNWVSRRARGTKIAAIEQCLMRSNWTSSSMPLPKRKVRCERRDVARLFSDVNWPNVERAA